MLRLAAVVVICAAMGCGESKAPSASTGGSAVGPGSVEGEMKIPLTFSGGHEIGANDYGRPVVLMAAGLGLTPDQFREAFSGVTPARGRGPTGDEQRKNKEALMRVLEPLGVTNERMDEVANYYRFRPQDGELWPTKEAEAYAVVKDGKIERVVVTKPGSGYSSPPAVFAKGYEHIALGATLKFDMDLKKNGGVERVDIVPSN